MTALEAVADELRCVYQNAYRWKWVILAMHSALQGMMVLALQGSDGLRVFREEDAIRWMNAHESGGPYPDDLKLDKFLDLYKKIKSDIMLLNVNSKKFLPRGTQGRSIKLLNRLRNEFVHFTPRVFVLVLLGLPSMSIDCLEVMEFLAWHSNNVSWVDTELSGRAKVAFDSMRTSLLALKSEYGSLG
ncbi:MAG: hypothetical protein JRG73_12875 [Deltaproteobacteria bacterium]|nr:hypothetical protein [Deltaproteobacteria bacterium]